MELVQDSFVMTNFTKKIVNTKWYQEVLGITFRQSSSLITEKSCDEELVRIFAEEHGIKETNLNKTQVEVRMLNIDWLLADRQTFVNFVFILKNASSDKIYQTELLDTLL